MKRLYIYRRDESSRAVTICNFSDYESSMVLPIPAGRWEKQFDSADIRWLGKGIQGKVQFDSEGEMALSLGPNSCVLYSGSLEER
jgi:hypothetical protein